MGGRNREGTCGLNEAVHRVRHVLNPDWEEAHMGWPLGWTNPVRGSVVCWPWLERGEWIGLPEQYRWEPPRAVPSRPGNRARRARVEAIGNGQVPACVVRVLSAWVAEFAEEAA